MHVNGEKVKLPTSPSTTATDINDYFATDALLADRHVVFRRNCQL